METLQTAQFHSMRQPFCHNFTIIACQYTKVPETDQGFHGGLLLNNRQIYLKFQAYVTLLVSTVQGCSERRESIQSPVNRRWKMLPSSVTAV